MPRHTIDPGSATVNDDFVKDEDNMASNSNTHVPTQQSVKAYVDTEVASALVADGDYGDITVSSSGSVMTIDNDVVTYAKMQNVSATNRFLGRITSGSGDVEELTAANGKTILGYPTSTTDNTVPRFDSTAGNIQTSGVVIDDSNNLSVGDGSATTAALNNIGDENTGIYFPAADTVGVTTGGVVATTVSGAFTGTTSLIDIAPSSRSISSSTGTDAFIGVTNAITMTAGSSVVPGILRAASTVTFDTSGGVFGSAFLFRATNTYKNANGVAMELGPQYTLVDQITTQADGAAVTQGVGSRSVLVSRTWNRINSGTMTVGGTTAAAGVWIADTIGAGVTMSNYSGIVIASPATTNPTNTIGIDVGAISGGTTGVGVKIGLGSTYSLQLTSTAGTAASGITFGTDTNLYRSAADTLKTDDKLLITGELELDGDLNHDGTNIGFFGVTPTTRQTELTDELTSITHTAPGTPDYAIQDLTDTGGFGFATKDEGNTVLSVIANLQTRVNELEDKLTAYGLLQDAD